MWLLLVLATMGIGATAVRLFRFQTVRSSFWIYAAIIGMALAGYLGLALSYMMGFTVTSQLVLCGILLAFTAIGHVFLPKLTFVHEERDPYRPSPWLIATSVLLFLIAIHTITLHHGDFYINNRHNYGDIRLHLSYINNFLYGQNIPVQNPIFAGTPASYPFLINFLTAQLIQLGLPVTWAINALTVAGFFLIGATIWLLAHTLTKRRAVADWSIILIFLGGGIGIFTAFLPEWRDAHFALTYLTHPPHDYSLYQDGGYWLSNMVIAFLSTQRTFLLGLPLTLLILRELYLLKSDANVWRYAGLGLCVGMLPLIHIASLIICAVYLLLIGIQSVWRKKGSELQQQILNWVWFVIPSAGLGLFLIHTFVSQTASLTSFLYLTPGWMSDGTPFLETWVKSGLFSLPLAILGIIWLAKEDKRAALFAGYSFTLFAIANFVVTQPWNFDNSKYLVYWFVFVALLNAYALMCLWERKQRALVVALIFCLIGSGTFDVVKRVTIPSESYAVETTNEMQLIDQLRTIIPPKATVLTYGSVLNPVVDYLGRRMVYGDTPWLWSHGIDYHERLAQVEQVYRGKDSALDVLHTLHADFVIVSDNERRQFTGLNETYFAAHFTPVFQSETEHLIVYKVP
jgi:hypothetical protein